MYVMPGKKPEDNASLQDIKIEYKILKDSYNAHVEELSRNFDILKHSKANVAITSLIYVYGVDEIIDISNDIEDLKPALDDFENRIGTIDINQESTYGNENILRYINNLIDELVGLEDRTNKLKQDLPIVKAFQLFFRDLTVLVGKLCTAVAKFFMGTEPKQQANEAKASMLMHFDKLKNSVKCYNKDTQSQAQQRPTSSFEI